MLRWPRGLQRPRVAALVGERVPAGTPEHMRMGLEGEFGRPARTLDHAGETWVVNGAPHRAPI